MTESQASAAAEPSAKKRRCPEDFKRDAVRLVAEEKYTFKAAAQAVGVSEQSLRKWHKDIYSTSAALQRRRFDERASGRKQTAAAA